MRARKTIIQLLAFGALLHLWLMFSPPQRLSYLGFYVCWLLPSAVFVAYLWWANPPVPPPGSARKSRARPMLSSGLVTEDLVVFFGVASVGLLMHFFPVYSSGPNLGADMFMLSIIFGGGCWRLLRSYDGGKGAIIPDGSRMLRAISWLKRSAGIVIACAGAALSIYGVYTFKKESGLDTLISLICAVGGLGWFLVGVVIALRRLEGDRNP